MTTDKSNHLYALFFLLQHIIQLDSYFFIVNISLFQ